jgi:hypothetical protein
MKIDSNISATLASLQPNHVGVLAWSLLASPTGWQAGGIPGQPDPDSPSPAPGEQPMEPGEPTLPDEAPPTPMA